MLGHLRVQILLGRALGNAKRLGLELGDGSRRLGDVDVHDSVDAVDILELADEFVRTLLGERLGEVDAVGVGPLFDFDTAQIALNVSY